MTTLHRLLTAALLLLFACGTEIGNPKKPKDGGGAPPPTAASLVDDRNAASDMIAAQIDEVLQAAAEEAHDAQLDLSGGPRIDVTPTTTRTCSAQPDGTAFVTTLANGAESRTATHHGNPVTLTAELAYSNHAAWTLPNAVLVCDDTRGTVQIDWTLADGLTMNAMLSSYRKNSTTRTTPSGLVTRSGEFRTTGERHVTWRHDPAADPAGMILLKKTVTSGLDKVFSASHHGTPVKVTSRIEAGQDGPLAMEILRDRQTHTWQSKTIVSGTVRSRQGTDSRFEATYDHLKFTLDSGCVPDSGSISGDLFRGPDTKPAAHFKVSFAAGAATISYDDGSAFPYVPEFCALDDSSH